MLDWLSQTHVIKQTTKYILERKVNVYRNGGIIKQNEKCFFDGTKIEIVKYYKYLGVLFSSRLSCSPAQSFLASQGSKALFLINRVNYEYEFPFNASYNLFEKCVVPILTYGSQIWGCQFNQVTEDVHIRYLKRQLGVGSTTPTAAVLGECGTFLIAIICLVNVVKFWFKILSSPENSLLRSCYNMLVSYADAGRENWASDVKHLLEQHGFGYVWEQQAVVDEMAFLCEFRDRLQNCHIQNWTSMKAETPKLSLYNQFKQSFRREPYLSLDIPYRLRKHLAKFRTTSVNFEIEIGRRHGLPKEDRLCKLCGESNIMAIGDEYHVLLECAAYSDVRKTYSGNCDVNLFTFCSILSADDKNALTCLANFISNVDLIRKMKLNTL